VRIELGETWTRSAQWVDLSHQVATHAVGTHQLVDPVLQKRDTIFAMTAHGHRQRKRLFFPGQGVWKSNRTIRNGHGMPRGDPVRCNEVIILRLLILTNRPSRSEWWQTAGRLLDTSCRCRTRQCGRAERCGRTGGCNAVADFPCTSRKPLKKTLPVRWDTGWILLVLLEEFFEEAGTRRTRRIDRVDAAHVSDPNTSPAK